MGTIPIPSIDIVDTCESGVSIDTFTKYRQFSILSLLCLWSACMYENLKKMSIKAKKKLKNAFFMEVCLMDMDEKSSIVFQDRIFHSCPKPFWQRYWVTIKLVLDGLNILVSVSKCGIDITKNRWYRIDLKKLVSPPPPPPPPPPPGNGSQM